MAYCSKCGVEVEQNKENCPLCGVPIHRYDDKPELSPLWPEQKERPKLSSKAMRFITVMPILTALAISLFIVLVIDFQSNKAITWSRYPIVSIITLFSISLGFLIFQGKKIINLAWLTSSIIFLLYFLDSFNGKLEWFSSIAVPLTLLGSAYIGVTLLSSEIFSNKITIQVTLQSLWISLLTVGVDFVINDRLTWSTVIATPLLIIFGIGLLLIFVVTRFINLDKYLHR